MKKKILYGVQYIDTNEINVFSKALRQKKIITGTFVKKFHDNFVKHFKHKHLILSKSGISVMHLALQSLNFKDL